MGQFRYIRVEGGKAPNPLVQILGFVVAAVMFGIAVLVGGIVLVALFGFVLLAGAVIYLRVWWLQRKLKPAGSREQGDTLDGEFRVIDITEPDEPDESERR